jgi:hypothetical protein
MIRYNKIFEAPPTEERKGIMVVETEEVDPSELLPYDLVLMEVSEFRRLSDDSALVTAIRERADDIVTAGRAEVTDAGGR